MHELLRALSLSASLIDLPAGGVVLEQRLLPPTEHGPRAVVLWMLSPQASECPSANDWAPSCPGSTRGCYVHGPTRVSLVDPVARRTLNTVEIFEPFGGTDTFDVPRKLLMDGPYHRGHAGAPVILWLHDYNGDGKKFEFALFDAESCSDLFTALIGYSSRQDRLVWYSVRSRTVGLDAVPDVAWPETLFAARPLRPGVWRYRLAWPGDEPPRTCDARYVPTEDSFEEVCHLDK